MTALLSPRSILFFFFFFLQKKKKQLDKEMTGTILQPVVQSDKPHWGCTRSLWLQVPSQLRAWGLWGFALCLQNVRQLEELPAPEMGLVGEHLPLWKGGVKGNVICCQLRSVQGFSAAARSGLYGVSTLTKPCWLPRDQICTVASARLLM